MVKKGDEFKDMRVYLVYRIKHLYLELQKVPFVIEEQNRESAIKTLKSRIKELELTRNVLDGNIKEKAKYEFEKVKHLKALKDIKVKERAEENNEKRRTCIA